MADEKELLVLTIAGNSHHNRRFGNSNREDRVDSAMSQICEEHVHSPFLAWLDTLLTYNLDGLA